jgi:superfamily II DNA/RNA helicase
VCAHFKMLTAKLVKFKNIVSKTPCLFYATRVPKKAKEPALITCKNNKLDLYLSDLKRKKRAEEEIVLASKGWQHYKAKGDHFIIHQTRDASDILKEACDYSSLNLNERLVRNLDEMHDITKATKLQRESIEQISSNENVLICAETGCGKTHAYLVPLFERILRLKADEQERQDERRFNSPLVLILTPTRELVDQIARMATELSSGLNINVRGVTGGSTKVKMQNPTFEDVDILVGSIGVLSKLTTTGVYRIDQVSSVVLDESDTLLDDSFNEKISYYVRKFPFHAATQLILVSATMPTSIDDVFRSIIDTSTLKHVVGDDLHKILPYVTQEFHRMNKTGRPDKLLRIVKNEVEKKRPVIVFSNKTPTCDYVSLFLNNNGINCVNVNGDMMNKIREGRFDKFQSGEVNVLSTTDCLGRGINTLRAKHVVNFDFPRYIADYIHRCGRIGRLGGINNNCVVTNFISSLSELDLVRKIELAARTNLKLENVDANIGKILRQRIEKEIKKEEDTYLRSAS